MWKTPQWLIQAWVFFPPVPERFSQLPWNQGPWCAWDVTCLLALTVAGESLQSPPCEKVGAKKEHTKCPLFPLCSVCSQSCSGDEALSEV